MILALLLSASLTAVDGDTVKDEYGQNMRLLGMGIVNERAGLAFAPRDLPGDAKLFPHLVSFL